MKMKTCDAIRRDEKKSFTLEIQGGDCWESEISDKWEHTWTMKVYQTVKIVSAKIHSRGECPVIKE